MMIAPGYLLHEGSLRSLWMCGIRVNPFRQIRRETLSKSLQILTTAALNFLAEHPRVDKQALGILGSVISGRAAVMSSRNREDVRAIALVSSLLDGEAKDAIKSRADRPINVIVSMQDALAAGQAREIYDLCEHPGKHIEVYVNAGEGATLWTLPLRDELAAMLADWFTKHLTTN